MSSLFRKLGALSYKASSLSKDIRVANLVSEPFEVKVLSYKKGAEIPAHTHSTETVHIVLKGRVQVEAKTGRKPTIITAGGDYKCGGWEYRGKALADTLILLIQQRGTTFVKSRK